MIEYTHTPYSLSMPCLPRHQAPADKGIYILGASMASLLETIERRAIKSRARIANFASDNALLYYTDTRFIHAGYIYLIHIKRTPFYKIGMSKDPDERLRNLFGVQIPFVVTVEHIIKTDNMALLESSLHEYFANRRIRTGEFFYLEPRDVAMIKCLREVQIYNCVDVKAMRRAA
jgi:hypothetical protein